MSSARFHWRDGREKHGPTRLYYSDDSFCGSESWSAGVLHGPYVRKFPNGRALAEGGYYRGEKHGRWTVWDASGAVVFSAEFNCGRRVGVWSQHYRPSPPPRVVNGGSLLEQVEAEGLDHFLDPSWFETPEPGNLSWTFDAAGNVLAMTRE